MWPSAADEENASNNASSRSRSRSRYDDQRYMPGTGFGRATCKRLFDAHEEEAPFSASPSIFEDSKRLRDSHSAATATTSAFTCSLLDNPASNALLWFGPQDGAARGIKSKNNRSGKPRGVFRRSRFLRASPKPVSSLESCLLRFDEDNQSLTRSLFTSYGNGASTPGLGEVEALEAVNNGENRPAFLPPLVKFRTRISMKRASSDFYALLFGFGICVGMSRIVSSSKAEVERLQKLLEGAEATVRALQMQIGTREAAEEAPQFVKANESSSIEVRSGLMADQQHDNMAELEAQLEAELELMQLHTASHHHNRMLSGVSDLDADDLAEVVRDELTTMGLPGASDGEDDRIHSEKNVGNWAVSPRELDRRLRMLLESRQEERISELETELQDAESRLLSTENELQLWKERVRQLSEVSLSGETTTRRLEKIREQSPVDDICDEFLRSVDEGIGYADVMAVSQSPDDVTNCIEPATDSNSNTKQEEGTTDSNTNTKQEETEAGSRIRQETEAGTRIWNNRHAGANTPNEDLHLRKLFNTPRDRARSRPQRRLDKEQPSVVDKIRYWENLARCSRSDAPSSPEIYYSQADQSCCSDGNNTSSDETSMSDDSNEEENLGDGLIKRLVAKSKNSTLLKDVRLMLAALEDVNGV